MEMTVTSSKKTKGRKRGSTCCQRVLSFCKKLAAFEKSTKCNTVIARRQLASPETSTATVAVSSGMVGLPVLASRPIASPETSAATVAETPAATVAVATGMVGLPVLAS